MTTAKMREAIAGLSLADPHFGAFIDGCPPCTLGRRRGGPSHFEQLARNIAYQQLAGKAAATIWGRVRDLVPEFTPEAVLALDDVTLRGAGLSRNKMLSLQDLARHVVDGALPLDRIARQRDETVIAVLIRVRGIGRWTAEMFLMFQMGRLDIWPVGDLGVRAGYAAIYSLQELPTVNELAEAGDKFRPWRSVAAWYCWRAADIATQERIIATKVKKTQ